jgi:hypothetical protein
MIPRLTATVAVVLLLTCLCARPADADFIVRVSAPGIDTKKMIKGDVMPGGSESLPFDVTSKSGSQSVKFTVFADNFDGKSGDLRLTALQYSSVLGTGQAGVQIFIDATYALAPGGNGKDGVADHTFLGSGTFSKNPQDAQFNSISRHNGVRLPLLAGSASSNPKNPFPQSVPFTDGGPTGKQDINYGKTWTIEASYSFQSGGKGVDEKNPVRITGEGRDRWAIGGMPLPVPEPSTLALTGVGALALAGCAWRRRARA